MPQYTLADLIELMARLRDPLDGCPWDLKQNFSSITKHTLEEVYEVIDAIEREDLPQLCDELGIYYFKSYFTRSWPASRRRLIWLMWWMVFTQITPLIPGRG